MVKPQHRTTEYRAARVRLDVEVKAGRGWCVQPECIMTTRYIPPHTPWDVAHDDSGLVILGAAHRRCNRRDGAVRGNKMRARKSVTVRRWRL